MSEPFVSQPVISTVKELAAYPPLYAEAFVIYNTLLAALVYRSWPTTEQKTTRDRFWSHFSTEAVSHG